MIAAAQSEEDSENIAEKFLHKEIDVDTFLNQYLEKRIVSCFYSFSLFFFLFLGISDILQKIYSVVY